MKARMLILPAAVLAVALAACGGSSSSSSSPPKPAKTATLLTIKAAKKDKVGDVLVNPSGLTLYRNVAEKGGNIACTGSCTKLWPPVLAGSGTPAAAAGITGKLGTIKRPDGTLQVTDNGWPLYHYVKDTSTADANGQGVDGIWFAAGAKNTPKAATASGGSSSSPSTSSSGGGAYGGGYGGY